MLRLKMATDSFQGEGAPHYNEGLFTVKYTKNTKLWGRRNREKQFTRYDEAKSFFDSIDDSAAIWDHTHSAGLCEAKTRIAYFAAMLVHKKEMGSKREVVTIASEPHYALVQFHVGTKGTDWVLLKESWREISEKEYLQMKAAIEA